MKYGSIDFPASLNATSLFIRLGNIPAPTKYAANPAANVEIYATIVVIISPFPDLLPNDAIPGTINPIIIKGITNDKKFPNKLLKVANIFTGT